MYLSRALERFFVRCSENFKAVALLGPRQVGKTTMLKRLADEEYERTGRRRTYVTLDDVDDRALAKSDPTLFLQVYKPPVLIDEIQKAPERVQVIKKMQEGKSAQAQRAGNGAPQPRRVSAAQKVGRNDPCPCGSGRKYKQCCGKNQGEEQ